MKIVLSKIFAWGCHGGGNSRQWHPACFGMSALEDVFWDRPDTIPLAVGRSTEPDSHIEKSLLLPDLAYFWFPSLHHVQQKESRFVNGSHNSLRIALNIYIWLFLRRFAYDHYSTFSQLLRARPLIYFFSSASRLWPLGPGFIPLLSLCFIIFHNSYEGKQKKYLPSPRSHMRLS